MKYSIEVAATVRYAGGPQRRTITTFTEEVNTRETGERLREQVLRSVERVTRSAMSILGGPLEEMELKVYLKRRLLDNPPLKDGRD